MFRTVLRARVQCTCPSCWPQGLVIEATEPVSSNANVKLAIVIGVKGGRGWRDKEEGARGRRSDNSVSISTRSGEPAARAATAPRGHHARCSSYVAMST
jgi:hypothetical protein